MDKIDILRDLVSFNTINDKDNKKIINYIEKYLKKYGFKTEYKTKCLVMSNKKNCEIGFLGHTDTVSYSNWKYNPFELVEKDNKLYGLGVCDMKGSIALILSMIPKINKGIKLFFTYDEEIGFKGINELIDNKISFPNKMIIGEPTCNEIINSSKGLLEFKLKFSGIFSHSSNPKEGENAIEKCVDFINEIKKYYKIIKKELIIDKYATMNIGVINGGRSCNIVPDSCELLIDFRTINKSQNKRIIKKINKLMNNKGSYEIINNINPFISESKINMCDFITEASFIDSKNKYILGLGPNNAHKKDEFIDIDSLNFLEKQYIEIIGSDKNDNTKC